MNPVQRSLISRQPHLSKAMKKLNELNHEKDFNLSLAQAERERVIIRTMLFMDTRPPYNKIRQGLKSVNVDVDSEKRVSMLGNDCEYVIENNNLFSISTEFKALLVNKFRCNLIIYDDTTFNFSYIKAYEDFNYTCIMIHYDSFENSTYLGTIIDPVESYLVDNSGLSQSDLQKRVYASMVRMNPVVLSSVFPGMDFDEGYFNSSEAPRAISQKGVEYITNLCDGFKMLRVLNWYSYYVVNDEIYPSDLAFRGNKNDKKVFDKKTKIMQDRNRPKYVSHNTNDTIYENNEFQWNKAIEKQIEDLKESTFDLKVEKASAITSYIDEDIIWVKRIEERTPMRYVSSDNSKFKFIGGVDSKMAMRKFNLCRPHSFPISLAEKCHKIKHGGYLHMIDPKSFRKNMLLNDDVNPNRVEKMLRDEIVLPSHKEHNYWFEMVKYQVAMITIWLIEDPNEKITGMILGVSYNITLPNHGLSYYRVDFVDDDVYSSKVITHASSGTRMMVKQFGPKLKDRVSIKTMLEGHLGEILRLKKMHHEGKESSEDYAKVIFYNDMFLFCGKNSLLDLSGGLSVGIRQSLLPRTVNGKLCHQPFPCVTECKTLDFLREFDENFLVMPCREVVPKDSNALYSHSCTEHLFEGCIDLSRYCRCGIDDERCPINKHNDRACYYVKDDNAYYCSYRSTHQVLQNEREIMREEIKNTNHESTVRCVSTILNHPEKYDEIVSMDNSYKRGRVIESMWRKDSGNYHIKKNRYDNASRDPNIDAKYRRPFNYKGDNIYVNPSPITNGQFTANDAMNLRYIGNFNMVKYSSCHAD